MPARSTCCRRDVVRLALREDWRRDPFDRIIVSQAALRGAPLVTKDRAMHTHYSKAVWGSPSSAVEGGAEAQEVFELRRA